MRRITCIFLSLYINVSVYAAGPGVPVTVQAVQQQPVFVSVQLTGTVTSPSKATLSVATSGLVNAIQVEEGAIVKAGEVLLELDAALAELQLDNMRAKHNQERIALQDAQRRRDEAKVLFAQKSFSKSSLSDLESEVDQQRAVLQQAAASMNYQQQIVARHRLRAPFAGVIGKKYIATGEWLAEGDAVFELVATQNLRADFYVAEDFVSTITKDARVEIWSGTNRNNAHQGRISTIVPVLDPVTRTFLLRVGIDEDSSRIIPGMSVTAALQVPTGREGIVVPKDALLRYPDGRVVVWVVSQDGETSRVAERVVATGESFGATIEVREGLSKGERVVVRGNESLQNGQVVNLQSSKDQ